VRVFIDTNLWVYPFDRREPDKATFVRRWLRDLVDGHDPVVSTQVMIELRSVLTRKLQPPLPVADVRSALEVLADFEVVAADAQLVLDAHELAQREQLAWFDALIVEAAIRSRCDVLYSEDFSHGRRFAGLTVCNPFVTPAGQG
jgi:predicted nucleic acid-binding protein